MHNSFFCSWRLLPKKRKIYHHNNVRLTLHLCWCTGIVTRAIWKVSFSICNTKHYVVLVCYIILTNCYKILWFPAKVSPWQERSMRYSLLWHVFVQYVLPHLLHVPSSGFVFAVGLQHEHETQVANVSNNPPRANDFSIIFFIYFIVLNYVTSINSGV